MELVKHVKIFADGADLDAILALYKNPLIKGFTTNPTLMRKGRHNGLRDIRAPARCCRSGPAHFVRGVSRRLRREDRASARDRVLEAKRAM